MIEGVRKTQVRMDRVAATRFSVFWYFKRNENILSGIFADLLRTDGIHGQGDTFLRLFLEELDLSRDNDALYRQAAEYELASGSFVETEHVIGGKRRIDIVVRLGERREQWLVVENKPWDDDQENQLADYAAYVHEPGRDPDACVVYVSGDGSDSETMSEKRTHYRTVPYRKGRKAGEGPSIEGWIRRCVEHCEADRVRWFLMDMHRYLQEVFQNEEKHEDE